jgi:hypothetical protein
MLDKLSIPLTLTLLLNTRGAALSAIFKGGGVLDSLRLRNDSDPPTVEPNIEVTVAQTVDAIALLIKTIDHVQTIFTPSDTTNSSMLRTLLLDIQTEPLANNSSTHASSSSAPSTALSLTKSLPSQAVTSLTNKSPSSLGNVFLSLPNAHTLLHYLPSQITSFTPFIDTSSSRNELPASAVNDQVETWFQENQRTLLEGFRRVLERLTSARQVARVRGSVEAFFDQNDNPSSTKLRDRLHSSLREAVRRRLREIYSQRLGQIVGEISGALEDAYKDLPGSKEGKFTKNALLNPGSARTDKIKYRYGHLLLHLFFVYAIAFGSRLCQAEIRYGFDFPQGDSFASLWSDATPREDRLQNRKVFQ